jgi:hypothetical protein
MAGKKPPKKGEKPQKERFIEAAKAAGVDGDAFERAMERLAPARSLVRPQKASTPEPRKRK